MLRRTGFQRPVYRPAPPAPPTRGRMAVMTKPANDEHRPSPKTVEWRNARILAMARGKDCLLHSPVCAAGNRETTVAAHSNQSIHGKAGARKADDCYSAWACAACHTWLDQGPATYAEKCEAFRWAHLAQITHWKRIAADPSEHWADRRAAQAALTQITKDAQCRTAA